LATVNSGPTKLWKPVSGSYDYNFILNI